MTNNVFDVKKKIVVILLLIVIWGSGCTNKMQCTAEKESEYVPGEFTPPRFTDDIYVSILYEDIYYKALYPEQTSILPEKALEVGTVESQTYLKISKPYSNMQTNCLDLPVGSKLYILDDTLYAYNDTTETYWMFSK